MKKVFVLVILLYSFSGFTQNRGFIIADTNHFDYTVKRATFIFEGEVISVKPFYSKNLYYGKYNSPYSSNIIKINKVFRGSPLLIEGTIELITYGKKEPIMMDDKIVGYEDNPNLSFEVGTKGVFFCVLLDSTNPNLSPLNSVTDNTVHLQPYAPYGYDDFIGFPSYYGLLRNFGNKVNVYNYLKRFENITIPKDEINQEK